jgi:hypothetical protein
VGSTPTNHPKTFSKEKNMKKVILLLFVFTLFSSFSIFVPNISEIKIIYLSEDYLIMSMASNSSKEFYCNANVITDNSIEKYKLSKYESLIFLPKNTRRVEIISN